MLFTHLRWSWGRCSGTWRYFYLEKEEDRKREDKKRQEGRKCYKYKVIRCFLFSSRTGQRANSAEEMEGLSDSRNQSKKKTAVQRPITTYMPQRHIDRWLCQPAWGCETVWIESQKKSKRAHAHTHTQMVQICIHPHNEIDTIKCQLHCTLGALNLYKT